MSDIPLLERGPETPTNLFIKKRNVFVCLALLLVGLAILRSAMTTRLDSFTIDGAYHIAAASPTRSTTIFESIRASTTCKTLGGRYRSGHRISTGCSSPIQRKGSGTTVHGTRCFSAERPRFRAAARKGGDVCVERPAVARSGPRAGAHFQRGAFPSVHSLPCYRPDSCRAGINPLRDPSLE
jgi:hypothetical protein